MAWVVFTVERTIGPCVKLFKSTDRTYLTLSVLRLSAISIVLARSVKFRSVAFINIRRIRSLKTRLSNPNYFSNILTYQLQLKSYCDWVYSIENNFKRHKIIYSIPSISKLDGENFFYHFFKKYYPEINYKVISYYDDWF